MSAPITDANRINHRTGGVTESTGIGDMTVGAKFWLFRPPTESHQNIQLGFALKMPTGKPNVDQPDQRVANPSTTPTTVDQSIQLGDGGTGFVLDYLAYKDLPKGFTLFSTGIYLFNPQEHLLRQHSQRKRALGFRPVSVPRRCRIRGPAVEWRVAERCRP